MSPRRLFLYLFQAKNEQDIESILERYNLISAQDNWYPYGGNENNFGVIENQQSNPVAALVEKVTNSIDAILMRRCYEEDIDPKSPHAPSSIEAGIETFFPDNKNWDMRGIRKKQAESIQIIADSEPRDTTNTSLIIYDDGEGQHPQDFEDTFLSLLRGNKNEIHFVQGKYNMGGSGAIVFCGKKRYQLLASKRFDGSGQFGFTLIRQHPLTEKEKLTKKNTWYEYFKIDGHIPSFNIDELDLGLQKRKFTTGTIIKLYSYDLKGNRNISTDLRRSLNQFMYSPALPFLTVESAERYPNDRGLVTVVPGLKQLLHKNDYIEETFSEQYKDAIIGQMDVTIHLFKVKAKGKKPKATNKTIQDEFFANHMIVQFSLNGQVHGYYTSEFISRSLKFPLLKNHLLIHVDCTKMEYEFRKELFMASRDRLKQGEESKHLRKFLADNLSKGRLKEIYKHRKDSISVEGAESSEDLLRSFAENLPISGELRHLLSKTFKLEDKSKPNKPKQTPKKKSSQTKSTEITPFNPQRFPSFFKVKAKENEGRRVIAIPLNGEKTVRFDTDVENNYFDRADDAGDMQIAILGRLRESNDSTGGNDSGSKTKIEDLFSVSRKSPHDGTIKLVMSPNKHVAVGDEIEMQADLSDPSGEFTQIFWVKITDPLPPQKELVKTESEEQLIGLPEMIQVYEDAHENEIALTWEKLEQVFEMDWHTVMYPLIEGDELQKIYINMSSSVLKNYKSKHRNITEEQNTLADRRYVSAIYFHTLFLYVINRKRKFNILRSEGELDEQIDLSEYLTDIFNSHYAEFLLNFGTNELMDTLG